MKLESIFLIWAASNIPGDRNIGIIQDKFTMFTGPEIYVKLTLVR